MNWGKLGCNLYTLSLLGTVVMTIVSAWGLRKQQKAIANNPSEKGKAVSVILFVYFTGVSIAQLSYARKEQWDFALVFNAAIRGITYFLVVKALWQVKKFTLTEKTSIVGVAMVTIGSIISQRPDQWFFGLALGSIIISLDQPWQIIKARSSGVVSLKMLFTLSVSTSFWVIYAFAADKWTMKVISPLFLGVLFLTMALWWGYRKKQQPVL